MHYLLYHFLETHRLLGYAVISVAMIFEGDLFLFMASFLTHQGFFDPFDMFIAVFLGVMTGNLAWYGAGFWLRQRIDLINRWAQKIAAPFDDHLKKQTFHTIFLSKFIYGVHHAILLRAGMLQIKFGKFVKVSIFSNLLWIVIVGSLGFISSASLGRLGHRIKFVEVVLLAAFVCFLLISYLISYEAKKKL